MSASAPPRSAEEIAREMVSGPWRTGDGRYQIKIDLGEHEIFEAPVENERIAHGSVLNAVALLADVISRARADGAAAALAAQQPRDLAGRIRALVREYAGRWCDIASSGGGADSDAASAAETALFSLLGACGEALATGAVSAWRLERMRAQRGACSGYVHQAADELEAIVRECDEKGGGAQWKL